MWSKASELRSSIIISSLRSTRLLAWACAATRECIPFPIVAVGMVVEGDAGLLLKGSCTMLSHSSWLLLLSPMEM